MSRTNKSIAYLLILGVFLLVIFSPLFAQQKYKICSQCGAKNPPNAKFCSKCGAKLVEPRVPPKPEKEIPKPEAPAIPEKPTEESKVAIKEMKAKAIYDYAYRLFEMRAYEEAIKEFSKVVREYPGTKYAEVAPIMIKGCEKLAALEKIEQKKATTESAKKSFVSGFMGFLGVIGGLVLFLLLAATVS